MNGFFCEKPLDTNKKQVFKKSYPHNFFLMKRSLLAKTYFLTFSEKKIKLKCKKLLGETVFHCEEKVLCKKLHKKLSNLEKTRYNMKKFSRKCIILKQFETKASGNDVIRLNTIIQEAVFYCKKINEKIFSG